MNKRTTRNPLALSQLSTALMTALTLSAAITGCSSMRGSEKDLSTRGPTVINARTEPSTVELNQSMQPVRPAEVLADVKDFSSPVTDVRLKFTHIPLEVPMSNIGGSTWRAEFTPQQLKMLAVSGKTVSYDANVVAKSKDGKTAMSEKPISVAVKAPDFSKAAG